VPERIKRKSEADTERPDDCLQLPRAGHITGRRKEADGDKAKARKKDPAAPSLGIGDTPQSGEAFALGMERIEKQERVEADDETDDELIELCWQDLNRSTVNKEDKYDDDEELVEECASFDPNPKLPGNAGGTAAIAARLKREAGSRSADDHHEAEQSEAKRMRIARFWRIQNTADKGMQSGIFDKEVRRATNQPPVKIHQGIAGDRIRRGEMHALQRIIKSSN
jgi:hypothetical protein